MKKIRLSFIVFTILFAFALISSSGGRATAAGEGNTGAPGDNAKVCSTCHSGGNFNPSINITVKDAVDMMVVSQYTPFITYVVEVEIASQNSPTSHGFQMVSLLDSDDSDVNGWSEPSSNSKIVSAMGRSYAEHNGPSSSNIFSINWTAPAPGSGNVTFYVAGNAVNLNGSPTGDSAAVGSLGVSEGATSPTTDISFDDATLTVYPNPSNDIVTLKFANDFKGRFVVNSMLGTKVAEWDIENGFGCVQIKDQLPGAYIFTVFDEEGKRVTTRKVIKI
jgi:hypothetical protein